MANRARQMAIEKFSRCIKDKLSTNVKDVRLFGSEARGTDTPESDIDILVLVEKDDRITSEMIMDIVVDVNLDYDVVISPIIMACSHYYANQLFERLPFFTPLNRMASLYEHGRFE